MSQSLMVPLPLPKLVSLGVFPVLGHWVWCGIQVQRLRDSCFALASLHCHIPPMKEWQQYKVEMQTSRMMS